MASEDSMSVTVDIHRTGVFATEDECAQFRKLIEETIHEEEGNSIKLYMNKTAQGHGLPETKSGYGILLPEGEFVCLESEALPAGTGPAEDGG